MSFVIVIFSIISGASAGIFQAKQLHECPIFEEVSCGSSEIRCETGTDEFGCLMSAGYCMPEGTVCPAICNMSPPAVCSGTDIMCDNGMDQNGCWMGNYCMPEGTTCPHVCPYMEHVSCGSSEIRCETGTDEFGCLMKGFCMAEDTVCPAICPAFCTG